MYLYFPLVVKEFTTENKINAKKLQQNIGVKKDLTVMNQKQDGIMKYELKPPFLYEATIHIFL